MSMRDFYYVLVDPEYGGYYRAFNYGHDPEIDWRDSIEGAEEFYTEEDAREELNKLLKHGHKTRLFGVTRKYSLTEL